MKRTYTTAEAAERYGVTYQTIVYRAKRERVGRRSGAGGLRFTAKELNRLGPRAAGRIGGRVKGVRA